MFGEFPEAKKVYSDEVFVDKWNKQFKEEFLTEDDIKTSLKFKKINNAELVKGNILDTKDDYLEEILKQE